MDGREDRKVEKKNGEEPEWKRRRKEEWAESHTGGCGIEGREEDNTLRISIDENTISDDNYSV